MCPPIDVRRRATARRTGTPGLSSLVLDAVARPAHWGTEPVEKNSPSRRRADHFAATVSNAGRVGCPANHAPIPGSRAGLVLGDRLLAERLQQQTQANKDWHIGFHVEFPWIWWLGFGRADRCRLSQRSSLHGKANAGDKATRAPRRQVTGFDDGGETVAGSRYVSPWLLNIWAAAASCWRCVWRAAASRPTTSTVARCTRGLSRARFPGCPLAGAGQLA